MTLHPPFCISARLAPALTLGAATLSLAAITHGNDGREIASFVLDYDNGQEYIDDTLRSGVGGFRSTVEAFESFLAFLEAAIERAEYQERTGRNDGDDALFPPAIVAWARDNKSAIECARMELCDESGAPRTELIED